MRGVEKKKEKVRAGELFGDIRRRPKRCVLSPFAPDGWRHPPRVSSLSKGDRVRVIFPDGWRPGVVVFVTRPWVSDPSVAIRMDSGGVVDVELTRSVVVERPKISKKGAGKEIKI